MSFDPENGTFLQNFGFPVRQAGHVVLRNAAFARSDAASPQGRQRHNYGKVGRRVPAISARSLDPCGMALTKDVYRARLDSARRRLDALKTDGLVATPSSNLFYLTGIDFHRSERLTALFLFEGP